MKVLFSILISVIISPSLLLQDPINDVYNIKVKARVVSEYPVGLVTLQHMSIDGGAFTGINELYVSPINSRKAGLMRVKGRPGSLVRMSYISKETLPGIDGDGYVTIRYEMSGYKKRIQAASRLIDNEDFEFTLNKDGYYYLWMGGKVIMGNVTPGKYKGQFTVEIQYI